MLHISAHGGAFAGAASDLVTGDTNAHIDVFVQDLLAGTTTRVSVSSSGAQGDDDSRTADISEDGRFVVLESWASNLVARRCRSGRWRRR